MHSGPDDAWHQRRQALLERARELKARPLVDKEDLLDLREEIDVLERRIDHPLSIGTRVIDGARDGFNERPGRAPREDPPERPRRRCPFAGCDGSGWNLREDEDIVDRCRCQALPRDHSIRRQNGRILRRHLALGLTAPPLSALAPEVLAALSDFNADLPLSVEHGRGLWLADLGSHSEAVCAFLTGEALRRQISVLLYPGDELIGRLRRLAGPGGGLEQEIYGSLAEVDLLLVDGLDAAAAPERYPELTAESIEQIAPEDRKSTDSEVEQVEDLAVPFAPAMTATDLSRLSEILDQRWANRRATVITTSCGPAMLGERLLRVAGEWPLRPLNGDPPRWDEARRRAHELDRTLSRLVGLCGPVIAVSREMSPGPFRPVDGRPWSSEQTSRRSSQLPAERGLCGGVEDAAADERLDQRQLRRRLA